MVLLLLQRMKQMRQLLQLMVWLRPKLLMDGQPMPQPLWKGWPAPGQPNLLLLMLKKLMQQRLPLLLLLLMKLMQQLLVMVQLTVRLRPKLP